MVGSNQVSWSDVTLLGHHTLTLCLRSVEILLCLLLCDFVLFPFQFYDLQKLFQTGGEIPDTSYVFMVIMTSFVMLPR